MDKTNQQVLQELKSINKVISNVLVFLLAREGYTQSQIRAVFGTMDNDRVTRISAGLKGKKK